MTVAGGLKVGKTVKVGRERVLVEFPEGLLRRTDEAARKLERNRSELIRTAVKEMLERLEARGLELKLAAAYRANADRNLELMDEFAHVDAEGF